jgi:hypothetical protein
MDFFQLERKNRDILFNYKLRAVADGARNTVGL